MFFIILFVLLALSITTWSPIARDHFCGGIFELIVKKSGDDRNDGKELRVSRLFTYA